MCTIYPFNIPCIIVHTPILPMHTGRMHHLSASTHTVRSSFPPSIGIRIARSFSRFTDLSHTTIVSSYLALQDSGIHILLLLVFPRMIITCIYPARTPCTHFAWCRIPGDTFPFDFSCPTWSAKAQQICCRIAGGLQPL